MTLQVAPPAVGTVRDVRAGAQRQSRLLVVAEQECRDLWTSGRGLILLFLFSVLLSGVTYLTSTNQALNFLEQRESVNLVLQFAVAVGVLATLVVSADGISGERERGTLETLLVTPVPRRSIIGGKLIAALSLWFATFLVSIPVRVGAGSRSRHPGSCTGARLLRRDVGGDWSGFDRLIDQCSVQLQQDQHCGQHFPFADLVRTDPAAQRIAAGLVLRCSAACQSRGVRAGVHLLDPRRGPWLDAGSGSSDHTAAYRDHRWRRTHTRWSTAGAADSRGECGMRAALLIALLVGALTWLPAPALAAAPLRIKVVVEPAHIETVLGGRFMITTEITNTGTAPSGEILAHLNVASIEGSVYVDPEDWSPSRSQQLSLRAGREPEALLGDTGRQCRPLCRVRRRRAVRRQGGGE